MKKLSISLLVIAIIILSLIGIGSKKSEVKKEYLRIHIRANSNLDIDQGVKLKVKEELINYLTPKVAECKTKQNAFNMLEQNLKNIESVSDGVLSSCGFNYKSSAKLNNESFPTRTYGSLTLNAGYYDALIIELGDGKGDNWWCVVYPPLCFTGEGESYEYRSKIIDIINSWLNK